MDSITRYQNKVYKVLREQKFVINKREEKLIQKRTTNGRRYFFMTGKRKEKGELVERFIKIPANNTQKLLLPFKRQIEIAKYIEKNNVISTRKVVASNSDPKQGVPYVILETFPTGRSQIGFVERDKNVNLLGTKEAKNAIDQTLKFHSISPESLPSKLKSLLEVYPGDYKNLRLRILKYLNKKVNPLDGKNQPEPFHKVLERRLGMEDIKNKIKELLVESRSIIDSEVNHTASLVHGDLKPDNLYVFDSGEVELLDLELVGISYNKAIAMMIDFGNLRARSWNNKKFRETLDKELLRIYNSRGQEELGKTVLKLSILMPHMVISAYFEDYEPAKQRKYLETRRRKVTENDIKKALKKKKSRKRKVALKRVFDEFIPDFMRSIIYNYKFYNK